MLWLFGKYLALYISGVCMWTCACWIYYTQMCLDACVHLHIWKRSWLSSVYPCTLLRAHVFLCVRWVREKSLSQCMTLSNRLGIKLMTTKTFPALKPIYTLMQASLMSALKSTTNSPWRKSLAHRECSGCFSLCVCVCACVGARVKMRVHMHVCVCACSPSVFSFMMTNHFLTFIFLDFTPLIPFMFVWSNVWGAGFCFGVRCFNKLSHI